MTAEPASDRRQQWELVVRRSFEIPDLVGNHDARRALIGHLQEQLQANGWRGSTRAIAEPMVDALLAMGASGDVVDQLLPAGLGLSPTTLSTRDAAYRLIDKGMTVVDPENLVFDVLGEPPSEVVATAQQALDRVCRYLREQPFDV